jgi:hypothetical protein
MIMYNLQKKCIGYEISHYELLQIISAHYELFCYSILNASLPRVVVLLVTIGVSQEFCPTPLNFDAND